jgi:acyl-CoA:acyl-CoA alkyltransferase
MRFQNVSIKSLAHIDAPHRISSVELEDRLASTFQRLGMRPGILEQVAGIKARRQWDPGVQPSEVAAMAGKLALDRANIRRQAIGMIINTSVCRDFIEPSTACLVHRRLELGSHCLNFDLGNACLGFINGMDVVAQFIESGQIDYGLVVDGESSRDVLEATMKRMSEEESTEKDIREQFATLTLGSGAAAMILCRKDLAPNSPQYLGGIQLAASEYADLCTGQVDQMKTKTKKLLIHGVSLAKQVWRRTQEEMQWSAENLDHLILHQVSQVHTMTLGQTLGLPLEKAYTNFDELGNIGPAAVPITLSKAAESGSFKTGDRIALMAIGSGLNCEMSEIVWGDWDLDRSTHEGHDDV